MTNIDKNCYIRVDVEEDLTRNFNKKTFEGVENFSSILDIFKKYNVRATLFVTGDVLKKYYHDIKSWSKNHEIACHGYQHIPLNNLSHKEREEDINLFLSLYENIFNKKPIGFRATQSTIDNFQLKLLEKYKFKYDCSVISRYPFFKRDYIGYKGRAPLLPYFPSEKNYRKKGEMSILELPNTALAFGFPLSGTWLRNFGVKFYKGLLRIKKPDYLTFNMHSWDGITINGAHSKNSGEKFIEYLDIMLQYLGKKYLFNSGDMIV